MEDCKLVVDNVHAAPGCLLARKLLGNFAKKMEGVERSAIGYPERTRRPRDLESPKSSYSGNLGNHEGAKANETGELPSNELKSRGRRYQPQKRITLLLLLPFLPYTAHSRAFLPWSFCLSTRISPNHATCPSLSNFLSIAFLTTR